MRVIFEKTHQNRVKNYFSKNYLFLLNSYKFITQNQTPMIWFCQQIVNLHFAAWHDPVQFHKSFHRQNTELLMYNYKQKSLPLGVPKRQALS